MLLELHLDYFGREKKREIEIFTKSGKIIGEFVDDSIKFSDMRGDLRFVELNSDMYLEEWNIF